MREREKVYRFLLDLLSKLELYKDANRIPRSRLRTQWSTYASSLRFKHSFYLNTHYNLSTFTSCSLLLVGLFFGVGPARTRVVGLMQKAHHLRSSRDSVIPPFYALKDILGDVQNKGVESDEGVARIIGGYLYCAHPGQAF